MKLFLTFAVAAFLSGCGVSSTEMQEEIAKSKASSDEYANTVAETKTEKIRGELAKRIVEIETGFATRTWTTEQVKQGQIATLGDVDTKLRTLEKQVEEIKKKVDVVNMANKEEVLRVLSELQGMTVTLIQQLKTQRDAMDASIKQLESIQVPEVPK